MLNTSKKLLEIAKLIGDPIDPNLPAPVELQKVANLEVAEPGEHVYVYDGEDQDVDEVYQINANGTVNTVQATLLGDVELNFTGYNTPLKYIRVDQILNSPDQGKLGRIKGSLTRSFDKLEVNALIRGIMNAIAVEEVVGQTGEDIYDVLAKTIAKIENYGDQYVLLAGSKVVQTIDLFSKVKAGTFNYKVSVKDYLKSKGVEVVKVFGQVKTDAGVVELMEDDKAILVAKNSRIANGKPIVFVRRKFGNIASDMGADLDAQKQRAIVFTQAPMQTTNTNTMAYGLFGVEQVVLAILNPRVIKKIDCSAVL